VVENASASALDSDIRPEDLVRPDSAPIQNDPRAAAPPPSNVGTSSPPEITSRPRLPSRLPKRPLPSQEDSARPWISASDLPIETWEVQFVGNKPVGYTRQSVRPSESRGAEFVNLELESLIRVSRSGQSLEQKLKVSSIEKTNGSIDYVNAVLTVGDSVTEVTATLPESSALRVQIAKDGQVSEKDIPWKSDYRGPFAIEQSMLRTALTEREARQFKYFDPIMAEMVDARLEAGKPLMTPILDGSSLSLMEITSTSSLGDKGLQSTLWVDGKGRIRKSYLPALDVRSYRCSKEFALSIKDAASWDLTESTKLDLPSRIPDPKQARAVVFKIRSTTTDPSKAFSPRTNQSVRRLNAIEAEVTVHAIRSAVLPEGVQPESQADPRALAPSPLIQSKDAQVLKLARLMTEGAKSTGGVARNIALGVHREVKKKDFSKAFASAAQVARELQGDCTEHSVLAAAIARATGIPSRLAQGLVYTYDDAAPRMAYHMWTEVFVENQWIAVDATTGEVPAPPDRLKISETYLEGASPYGEMLPIATAMGKLEIVSVSVVP
jgi:hypothetical protein